MILFVSMRPGDGKLDNVYVIARISRFAWSNVLSVCLAHINTHSVTPNVYIACYWPLHLLHQIRSQSKRKINRTHTRTNTHGTWNIDPLSRFVTAIRVRLCGTMRQSLCQFIAHTHNIEPQFHARFACSFSHAIWPTEIWQTASVMNCDEECLTRETMQHKANESPRVM